MSEDTDGRQSYRPFLSISSTAPVTAGFVALMRSLDPSLTPADCKEILLSSSRPRVYEGMRGPRVPDAFEAVRTVWSAGH
jgi:hypothetical protein